MKRFGNFFNAAVKASAFMVAAVVAFSSCEEKVNPSVTVNPTEIAAEPAGDSYDVTVNANVAWTAEAQDKWVTVSPAEGVAGETKVTVTVKKNNSEDARETTVTFAGEGAIATVAVNQFGKDVVSVDKKTYAATPAGGSDAVKVTANTDWTATSDAEWVTVTPAEGAAGETAVTVAVAANAGAEAREAKVTFVAGDAKAEYTVSQEAVSVTLSQNSVNVAGEGADVKVTVTANAAWEATSSAEWVTVTPAEGEAGAVEVTVSAAANETDADRNATVTFAINENVKVELAINQAFVKPTGKVVITIPNVTSSTATVVCTPEPVGFTYFWDYIEKESVDAIFTSDDEIVEYLKSTYDEILPQYGYTWGDVIYDDVDEYVIDGLDPSTSYYVLAFGIDASGNVTSGLFKEEFTTKDVSGAVKAWIGTWNLTSTQTYYNENGGKDGVYDEVTERTITIGTDTGFGLQLAENELVVSGLSYTDALGLFGDGVQLETVATVGEGTLKFKNGCEVFDATEYDLGIFTWIGFAWSDALQGEYVVSGGYAPYTLTLGADKVSATGTPYAGQLSNGADFRVIKYDMFISSGGGYSSYYSEAGYGSPSGTWTLTKVQDEPAAAPQSVKTLNMIDRMIKSNAKFMNNFNAKAIYKSAQAR